MRALITGGAGFIGSHLSELLLEQGYQVAIIDDLSTGSFDNIAHLKDVPGFSYHLDTIFNRQRMAELVDQADIIFHLAAAVGVRLIVESPIRTLHTNVRGTEIVLEAAVKKNKKVIVASTSEVYGKAATFPFREDADLVLGPTSKHRWSYACSKLLDEFLALGYYREKGLPVVILRFFNTVGPRQTGTYGMVLPRFVSQAFAGEPLTIYGDGEQRRCFSWVGDVVSAVVRLSTLPSAAGQVFNIGGDQEIEIRELALLVKEVAGSDSPLQFVPYEQIYGVGFEDMMRRVPDLSRVQGAIGYRSTKTVRQIVEAVVSSMRDRRHKVIAFSTAAAQ